MRLRCPSYFYDKGFGQRNQRYPASALRSFAACPTLTMPILLFSLSFLLLSTLISSSLSPFSNVTDEHSLLQFKAAITSDPLHSLANWNPNISFCNWSHVTCSSRRQRVVALQLSNMTLQGSISPFLGNLSFLRSLDLSNNTFHGLIPPQLGRLFRLRQLILGINKLEGHIPIPLTDCRNLELLSLSFNSLSGSIPPELGFLTHLKGIYLGANSLTGAVPSSLGNLSALIQLDLPVNILEGDIPDELGKLSHLQSLDMAENELSGTIPDELGKLSHLHLLYMAENELSGTIPSSLSNISSMIELDLSQNQLSGHIPEEFGSTTLQLQLLSLWGNQLSGNIPSSLGNCSNLTILALNENKLSGVPPADLGKLVLLERIILHTNQLVSGNAYALPFLTALTNCSLLEKISLRNNQLGGMLPRSMGHLSPKLTYLHLGSNSFGGRIPYHIGNLTNLEYLNLSHNFLSGGIPTSFKKLQKLQRLYLQNNRLEGSIPSEIGELTRLGLLSADHNFFSGRIPDSFGHLQQLRRLDLNHNLFSGRIPPSLGNCMILELVDLSHNRFSGSIPPQVAGLQNLAFYLNLSWNSLQGALPAEIGKIVMAQSIDVSANKLTGFIPETLGSCIALAQLNLSQNAFRGPIPSSLSQLQNLEDMDLSSNSLSGTLPKSFKKLKMLRYLDLSFNKLTGEISQENFANHSIIALFMGNIGLCGPPAYSLPPCPQQKNHSFSKKVAVTVATTIAFVTISSIVLFKFLWRRDHSKKLRLDLLKLMSAIAQNIEHPRISYEELLIATGEFDEANLLGEGSFGTVYKGTLKNGTLVAVKVFNIQNEEMNRSFVRECRTLGTIRHRNLVRIITSCSNHHFKGLVLQFMPNGSLEKHLYPNGDESSPQNACGLNLNKRLDILIGVAHGLSYLHHDCFVEVVHCDLKPANILLDEDMTAHVTDFGIARLLGANSVYSLTSTHMPKGSIGYIAPEYGFAAPISTKGDVYSFGIVLMEMLTRKRPVDDMFVNGMTLQKWVSSSFSNNILEVVDSSLLSCAGDERIDRDDTINCLNQLLSLALLCTNESPQRRPNMREIVGMLEKIKGTFVGTIRTPWLERDISHLLNPNVEIVESHSSSTQ